MKEEPPIEVRFDKEGGSVPLNEFDDSVRVTKDVRSPSSEGMVAERLSPLKNMAVRRVSRPTWVGIVPLKRSEDKPRCVRSVSCPS